MRPVSPQNTDLSREFDSAPPRLSEIGAANENTPKIVDQ